MEKIHIRFFCEETKFILKHKKPIKEALIQLMKRENKIIHELNYIFCNDIYLHKINVEYLNHDTYTDVITFEYDDEIKGGDIFISIERVKENAKTLNIGFTEELHRVMIHGLLHLCAYKDKNPQDKEKMTFGENFYLKMLYNSLKK